MFENIVSHKATFGVLRQESGVQDGVVLETAARHLDQQVVGSRA